ITNTTDVALAPPSTTRDTPNVSPHPILAHAPTGLVKVLEAGELSDSGPHASPASLSSLSIE
ncbi:MAG: hypothetical protein ACP5HZ_12360, partial [Ferrimicrobium sp.]